MLLYMDSILQIIWLDRFVSCYSEITKESKRIPGNLGLEPRQKDCMLATHPKRRWPFVSKAVSMSCTLGPLVYAQSAPNRPAAASVYPTIYDTMERWVEGTIVPLSDGPGFILIDWD